MRFFFWEKIKSSYHWRSWHAYLFLILAALIVYGQSLFFDYSYFDDQQLILEHADILERANPAEIFLNDVFFSAAKYYYRPLLTWSLVCDWHWGGGTVFAFHLSNIIFHAVAACLLFYLLRLIDIREKTALFLSLLFTIHPVLSPAVAWIPGRNDVLVAVFIWATLIFWSRWLRREKIGDLVALWLFFLSALLSKETAILLPLFALAWMFVFEYRYFTWFKLLLASAGALVSMFLWALLRLVALGGTGSGLAWQSLGDNLWSPLIFLGKVVLPVNLSVYPVPADSPWIYGIISLLILMLLLFYSRPWRGKRLLFGFAWFWLFLVLGSIRPDSDVFRNFMEHRLYVPMFGLLIILAETEKFWQGLPLRRRRYVLATILVVLATINLFHSRSFRDRLSFWEQAASSSPHSALAQRNLGAMYYLEGDLEKAEGRFRQSLFLNSSEPMAHNNLAAIYIDRGDFGRAEIELKKELAINPQYDLALYNLGRVYYQYRRYQEAAALWNEALRLNPRLDSAAQALTALQSEAEVK
ncbi:MAG TPA: tetratricopeptide repeat protein [bacterium]|jgi:tetratricopeptide (TPR) repeat protein|nr:tetratricopeptide repeat protein [bacterium]HQB76142.1 tetratricopeptide repeat protein [bacterium]HQQ38238.1 tetratricopeptide repeat protein [bacterium]